MSTVHDSLTGTGPDHRCSRWSQANSCTAREKRVSLRSTSASITVNGHVSIRYERNLRAWNRCSPTS